MYHPICSFASLGELDAADSAPVAPRGYDSPKMTFPRKVGMAPNSPASKTDRTNLTTNHNHYSSTVCITTGVQMVFRSVRRCHKVLHVFPICQHLKSLWLCSQGTTKFHHIEMGLDRRFDVSACGISHTLRSLASRHCFHLDHQQCTRMVAHFNCTASTDATT